MLDWLKLLLVEELDADDLKMDGKNILPKLHGALLKNEQDVHLLKDLLLWPEGIMRAIKENVFNYNDPGWLCIRHTVKPKT